MLLKRCFTLVHCELSSKCECAYTDPSHGYFEPRYVGDACHHFKPLAGDAKEWGIGPDRDEE